MRTQKISFPSQEVLCVFPSEPSELVQGVSELQLNDGYPVIVLIGGAIDEQQAGAARWAIQTITRVAGDLHALVVCGGTDMGVMAEMGQIRWKSGYKFPLIGIAPEALVTWTDGPHSTKFLWWGTQRWQLEPHYSHFILVPGSQFGDESPWIFDTATMLSKDHRSVTILISGGEVSKKDIDLSLENGRPVIVLSRTGRLADELARQPNRHKLITVVPANAEQRIVEALRAALSVDEKSAEAVAFQVIDRVRS
jgi:SLOG in TRPM, prokaryote